MQILKIDHIGIIVNDLSAAKAFFVDLGLEVLGEWTVEGDPIVERVIGLDHVRNAAVMLSMPGGGANIELVQFLSPAEEGGIQQLPANALGIRHISCAVDDLEAVVARLKAKGMEIFSEIQDLAGYKLLYVRGPEGIILELAEQMEQ